MHLLLASLIAFCGNNVAKVEFSYVILNRADGDFGSLQNVWFES